MDKHKHTHIHKDKQIRILLLLFCEMGKMMSMSPQTPSSVAFSQEELIMGYTEYSGSREQRWAHLGQGCSMVLTLQYWTHSSKDRSEFEPLTCICFLILPSKSFNPISHKIPSFPRTETMLYDLDSYTREPPNVFLSLRRMKWEHGAKAPGLSVEKWWSE